MADVPDDGRPPAGGCGSLGPPSRYPMSIGKRLHAICRQGSTANPARPLGDTLRRSLAKRTNYKRTVGRPLQRRAGCGARGGVRRSPFYGIIGCPRLPSALLSSEEHHLRHPRKRNRRKLRRAGAGRPRTCQLGNLRWLTRERRRFVQEDQPVRRRASCLRHRVRAVDHRRRRPQGGAHDLLQGAIPRDRQIAREGESVSPRHPLCPHEIFRPRPQGILNGPSPGEQLTAPLRESGRQGTRLRSRAEPWPSPRAGSTWTLPVPQET